MQFTIHNLSKLKLQIFSALKNAEEIATDRMMAKDRKKMTTVVKALDRACEAVTDVAMNVAARGDAGCLR